MRVEVGGRTRHHRKRRRVQCVESSDHYALASACVTFVQDLALSLLSVPYIAIPDRRCALGVSIFKLELNNITVSVKS